MIKAEKDRTHFYEQVTLKQWLDGFSEEEDDGDSHKHDDPKNNKRRRKRRLPLIDLRESESFASRHIDISTKGVDSEFQDGSDQIEIEVSTCPHGKQRRNRNDDDNNGVIVNLPFPSLLSGERSCELPPRNVSFAILVPQLNVNENQGSSKEGHIAEKNIAITKPTRTSIIDFFFATISKATSQSRKPWLVKQILFETDTLWKEALDLGILNAEKSLMGHDHNNSSATVAHPLPRLWKPDYMVQTVLLPLLKDRLKKRNKKINITDKTKQTMIQDSCKSFFTILDLGSGAGRDVCFLAEELKYYQKNLLSSEFTESDGQLSNALTLCVVGIDNHKGSAKRCLPLWKNRQVGEITKSQLLNLNQINKLSEQLTGLENDVICLYAIRFLNRKLIQQIATCRKIDPCKEASGSFSNLTFQKGTIFAMSHFCKEESGSWNFDHPKEASVLDRWELRDLFSFSNQWDILHDNICMDSDHGRTLINFIATLN